MRRLGIAAGILVAAVAAAFALAGFVPSIQDEIVSRAIVGQVAKADAAAAFKDDALHILLCGTGSPMLDPKRANACTAIIAGGHVVVIDAGPGAWAKLAQAMVPAAQVDTVLLTHLIQTIWATLARLRSRVGSAGAKSGAEEAVTAFDKDGLKIEAFLVSHDPAEPAYGYRNHV